MLVIAAAIALSGIIVGIYVGVWLMVFGGFADAINLFKTSISVNAADVAITLSKIIFGIPVGLVIAFFCWCFAYVFYSASHIETDEKLAEAEKEHRRALGYDE